jgi:glycosyltransferase involved in cell wall biosynthesis
MEILIENVLAENHFDMIYLHLFRMAPYFETLNNFYRIVDLTDMISKELIGSMPYRNSISKFIYRIENPRIVDYEKYVADHFDEIWLISENDQKALSSISPAARIEVIRNGVNIKAFYPTGMKPAPNSLVFVGHMGVFHNIDAVEYLVRELLPIIRGRVPEVTLKIIGASPKRKIIEFNKMEGISVTGFEADLNTALNRSSVFVAPLRFAAGVQNKILEAMASGTPVVTTSIVNQGLGAQPGRDLLVADNALSFAENVINLLIDSKKNQAISHAGREFVKTRYDWNLVRERVYAIQSIL